MIHMRKRNVLAAVVLVGIVLGCIVVYLLPPLLADPIVIQRYAVDEENDDGRSFTVEYNEKGYGTEYDWGLLQLAPSYSFGVKFDNISIPEGMVLSDAYVELYSVGTPGHRHPNCRIYCDASDFAVDFSVAGALDISGRNYTENFTRWNASVAYDQWVSSPCIRDCLQEIFARENWTAGNSVAVLFVSEGVPQYAAAFRNYGTGYPARLVLELKPIS